ALAISSNGLHAEACIEFLKSILYISCTIAFGKIFNRLLVVNQGSDFIGINLAKHWSYCLIDLGGRIMQARSKVKNFCLIEVGSFELVNVVLENFKEAFIKILCLARLNSLLHDIEVISNFFIKVSGRNSWHYFTIKLKYYKREYSK